MALLTLNKRRTKKGVAYYLQFTTNDPYNTDRRQTLNLGVIGKTQAGYIRARVQALLNNVKWETPLDDATAQWAREVGGTDLGYKLAAAGLLPGGEFDVVKITLGDWVEQYKRDRPTAKPATRAVWDRAFKALLKEFGSKRPLETITRHNARTWRDKLAASGLAENTVRKLVATVKALFNAAVDDERLPVNPFARIPSTTLENRARDYTLTAADSDEVLKACPDAEWRVIFCLARWAGVRVPSEVMPLQWSDVNWALGRMRITSPKTAGSGKPERWVPLFADTPLAAELSALWDLAPEGATYVIAKHRGENLRTQFERIVTRAGLTPWPKIFHNLRGTRQTELSETYPSHVVCAWLGNTPRVADKSYLRLLDEHWERATRCESAARFSSEPGGAAERSSQKPREK